MASDPDADEADLDLDLERRETALVNLAAQARASLAPRERQHNLSRMRQSMAEGKRHSAAVNFHNEAFMSKILEEEPEIDVGNFDVALPEQIPVHVVGPVEAVNAPTTTKSILSDPDDCTPVERRALIAMAIRAVLNLCTYDRADELELQCIQVSPTMQNAALTEGCR